MNDGRVKVRLMHAQDARFVFVRIMGQFWLRTDACVAFVPCPTCKAATGDPCTGSGEGPRTETHYTRRRASVRHLTGVAQLSSAEKTKNADKIAGHRRRARAERPGLLRAPWARDQAPTDAPESLAEWVASVKASAEEEPAEAYVAITDYFGPWTIGWFVSPERYTLNAHLTDPGPGIRIEDWLLFQRIAKEFGAPPDEDDKDLSRFPNDPTEMIEWSWPRESLLRQGDDDEGAPKREADPPERDP